MTHIRIPFAPGINKEDTDLANEGRWRDGNLVRFRDGKPESVLGWTNIGVSLTGVARAVETWQQLDGNRNIGFGTTKALYVIQGTERHDVTPIRRSQTGVANAVTTTNGSATVSVSDAGHGASVGDRVIFSNASATVGGLTIDGEFSVAAVTDANTWTFIHTSAATSSATGPASIDFDYLLTCGLQDARFGRGWGTGLWGKGTWGTPRDSSTVVLEMGQWSLDTWGEDLIGCPRGGKIYLWDASGGTSARASLVHANAPTKNRFILVSRPDRHLVAFGTEDTIGSPSTFDPLLIRWSDIEDFTLWSPASTNTAGSFRVTGGSKIVAAVRTRLENLILTNSAVWRMRLIGGTFVFGFDELGTGCGAIGQHAAIDVNGIVYWMGDCDFYRYDGRLQPIQCDVHNFVFSNLDSVQGDKVFVGHNKHETEIIWFYQDKESGDDVNRAVAYNYVDGTWWLADVQFARTTWIDRGVFTEPIASDPVGRVFFHERGRSADGSPISRHIESGDLDLVEGDQAAFVRKVVTDFRITSGSLELSLKARRYPNLAQTTKTRTLTASTGKVNFRSRGRQHALRLESGGADDEWRMGEPRFDATPDGRR